MSPVISCTCTGLVAATNAPALTPPLTSMESPRLRILVTTVAGAAGSGVTVTVVLSWEAMMCRDAYSKSCVLPELVPTGILKAVPNL